MNTFSNNSHDSYTANVREANEVNKSLQGKSSLDVTENSSTEWSKASDGR